MMDSHELWSASPPNLASVLIGTAPLSALRATAPQSTPKQPQNHSVGGRELSDDWSYPKYIYSLSFSLSPFLPLCPLFPLVCVCLCLNVCVRGCVEVRGLPLVLSHRHCPPFYSDRSFSLPWDAIKSRSSWLVTQPQQSFCPTFTNILCHFQVCFWFLLSIFF